MTCENQAILERVVEFLQKEIPSPRPAHLTMETDLRKNLRMADEDADELLAKFFQQFEVLHGNFDHTRYFPSEGLLFFRWKTPSPVPLTIGMLVKAACDGVWDSEKIENGVFEKRVD